MGYCLEIIFGQSEIKKYLNGEKLTNYEKIINLKKYEFETCEERNAFYKGINETVGWLEYHIIKEFEINLNQKEEIEFDYWGFIQKYYPNYYHCDNVLLSNTLTRIMDGEFDEEEDKKHIQNRNIRKELMEVDKELLSIAFENFFNLIYPENK
jgi:hypothetical protein